MRLAWSAVVVFVSLSALGCPKSTSETARPDGGTAEDARHLTAADASASGDIR